MIDPDTLPGIELDELAERAGLMTRVDRKYLVPTETAEELTRQLDGTLRVLDIDGRRTFGYRSTYYDTDRLDAFRAAAGRRRRFKVRRRRDYLDTAASFLEVKTPTGRGESSKLRIPVPAAAPAAGPLPEPELAFVHDALDATRSGPVPGRLVPVLGTEYDRTTLHVGLDDTRLTIDSDLTWSDPRAGKDPAHLPGLVVVETKGHQRPGAADRLLWEQGHRPLRLSKYATGLALLDPDLPANRWHRTLKTLREDAS